MRWPWTQREERSVALSIGDPATAAYFGIGHRSYAGVAVNESSALALSAVYRAVALISGTLGTLPMPTYRQVDVDVRERVASFLDDPGGTDEIDLTPFEWKQTVLLHLTLNADSFLVHQFNGAGAVVGLLPVHPLGVSVRWRRPDETQFVGRKVYRITFAEGQGMAPGAFREFDRTGLTQVSWMSLDGLRGCSPIAYGANSIGTAIAGDRAAAKMFGSGAMLSGVMTPEEDVDEDEAKAIKAGIERNAAGWENAAEIAVINRRMKFTPWQMNAVDAQFLESRQFSVEEVSRWFGVPPHLLMQMDKQTSWGSGVEVQNRAMARTVLAPWATLVEQRLSRLLSSPRSVAFDFAALERPTPEAEVDLLIKQVEAGLITIDEARHARGLPPLPAPAVAPAPAAVEEVPT